MRASFFYGVNIETTSRRCTAGGRVETSVVDCYFGQMVKVDRTPTYASPKIDFVEGCNG